MTPFFDQLYAQTKDEREAFIAIPVIQHALKEGVDSSLYLDFLEQAYHHVKHTCRLLGFSAGLLKDGDETYLKALLEYIEEERGHEEWILDDIRDLGGDAQAVRNGSPDISCRLMVAYVYYAVQHVSPYAMLGMVHVLEGMSAALALAAVKSLKNSVSTEGNKGFSYLSSHGHLDQEHVDFFRNLVNGIEDPVVHETIIDTANVVYRLYGDIFRSIAAKNKELPYAN